jgi:HEAT repeat protein
MSKVTELIEALKDASFFVRERAAYALGEIKDPRAVEPLIAALGHNNKNVRSAIKNALDTINPDWRDSKEAKFQVSKLIAALLDENEYKSIRSAAAYALGDIKDSRAIEPLIATLKDKDEYVRFHATNALDTINPDWRKVKEAKLQVSKLIAALKDENKSVRYAAAEALGFVNDPHAVEPLIAMLDDKNEVVRYAAAEALGKIQDLQAVEPLIAALKDKDVRYAAIRALGEIQDPRAVEPLIAALKDENKSVRYAAARTLGSIKDTRSVEPLITALGDKEFDVRFAAENALNAINPNWRDAKNRKESKPI